MIRQTTQKTTLMHALASFSSFFNAYDLHKKVEKKNIGIATVYRFLKNLEQRGSLHSYTCDNTKVYSLSKKNHAHFMCERCGLKKHLDMKKVNFLQKDIPGKVCHFQLDVVGVCDKCSSNH